MKLNKGTILYHGTDCPDYQEEDEALDGPGWVTTSPSVAERFARRPGWGGTSRVIVFELDDDVVLPTINSMRERNEFAEEHDICFDSAEDMRDTVRMSGIAGWIIPNNYPDGDDILLADTRILRYLRTELCSDLEIDARAVNRPRP